METSKVDLRYLDPETNKKYLPYVIEPSLGLDRLFLAVLSDAYDIEILENKEEREVLHLHPALAPYKVSILPLIKKFMPTRLKKYLELFVVNFQLLMMKPEASVNVIEEVTR